MSEEFKLSLSVQVGACVSAYAGVPLGITIVPPSTNGIFNPTTQELIKVTSNWQVYPG